MPNRPPAWMRQLFRRGLALVDAGRGGEGLRPATIAWARRLAAGEAPTPEKVRDAVAWLARHQASRTPGWDAPGEETPGFVSHLLWGDSGNGRGRRWWEAQANALEDADEEDEPTKAGRRHSTTDEAYMAKGMGYLRKATDAFKAAGAPDADGDGLPDALEGKSLNYDEESRRVRDAWYAAFPDRDGPGSPPAAWPETVAEDYLIVRDGPDLFRVPYRRDGDGVIFAGRELWEPVRQAYLTEDGREVKADERAADADARLSDAQAKAAEPGENTLARIRAIAQDDGRDAFDDGERAQLEVGGYAVLGDGGMVLTDKGRSIATARGWLPAKAAAPLADGSADHAGAMIALVLPLDARAALLAAAGDAATQDPDHLTLAYLTEDAETIAAGKNALLAALAHCAAMLPPLVAEIGGVGRFAPADGDEGSALYASVDSPDLPALRAAVVSAAEGCGCLGPQTHGFTPHITLGYLAPDAPTPPLQLPRIPLRFDALTLVWGGERVDFPLQGAMGSAAVEVEIEAPGEDAEATLRRALGLHPTAGSAEQLQYAGYTMEDHEKAAPVEALAYGGEPVKSLGGGRFGGYLVRFSSPDDPDLAGEYFTKDTDFGPHRTSLVFYHHGQDAALKRRLLDPAATLKVDAFGVWVEGQIAMRDAYERWIADEIAAGRMGLSSGSAAHLVERVPARGATWIKSWPLGLDASLTPIPCEPRNVAVPLKSLPPAPTTPAASLAAPAISTSTRRLRMDEEQLKALLAEALKGFGATLDERIAAREAATTKAIEDRLKAIEDSPAIKSAGYVSMDGGANDKATKSFGDWLLAVKRRDVTRLERVYKSAYQDGGADGASTKDLSGSSGASGGYLVPTEYEPMLEKIAAEAAIVEPRARQIRMSGSTKLVPMLRQTANPGANDGDSAFFGGVSFVWNAEGADISTDKSDPVFDMVEMIARKLTGLTVASNEIVEDATSLESDLLRLFGEGLAHARDFFYLRGNGVGRPLGVLNAPARYTQSRQASGNSIEIEDVAKMLSRLTPMSIRNAVWVANPIAIQDIVTLKLGDTPVWQPDARVEIGGTLMGRPLLFSEYLPVLGSVGDLILCDFQFYGVATRRGITIAASEHARFDTDQITWRVTYRGDGKPLLDAPVKLADGSNTQVSPFVVLGS